MQSWDSGSRYESPIGLQWWFIMGYLRTWQDSSNNGAHWQSHRTRSGMELRTRVTYLQYLEMFSIQESFVHAHSYGALKWRGLEASIDEQDQLQGCKKQRLESGERCGEDIPSKFACLRPELVCGKVHFVSGFILLHYFTFVSPSCQSRNWAFPVDGSYAGLEQPCGFASPGVYRHHHWVQPVVIRCLSVRKHRCQEPAKSFSILSPIYVIVCHRNSYCHIIKTKTYHIQKDL